MSVKEIRMRYVQSLKNCKKEIAGQTFCPFWQDVQNLMGTIIIVKEKGYAMNKRTVHRRALL